VGTAKRGEEVGKRTAVQNVRTGKNGLAKMERGVLVKRNDWNRVALQKAISGAEVCEKGGDFILARTSGGT